MGSSSQGMVQHLVAELTWAAEGLQGMVWELVAVDVPAGQLM